MPGTPAVPFDQAADFFRGLQDRICANLEAADGKARFHEDAWQRPGGGGGRTRVIRDGAIFEKGGVSFSLVHGEFSEEMAKLLPGEGRAFRAAGVSLVLHPFSPMVPTVHANFRLLTRENDWWFGGGADLTPYYPFAEDCVHFHRVWRDCCDRHPGIADHAKFKKWCDEYFYLPHRQEPRGIGGIFFDYLRGDFATLFTFVRDAGDSFLPAYLPILERRKNEPFGQTEKEFQLYRRGRYVEFNLLYDRGTVFGLKTQGRTESILMSLPPLARWDYDFHAAPNSREAQLLDFLKPRDWANGEVEVPRK